MSIRFDGRVAIVTGAGVGLGRAHALGLARLGAKVVVNDLGVATDGTGSSSAQAEAVVKEIEAMGGEAMAHGANVTDEAQVQDMVDKAIERFGKVDILLCNAGILRDKTFSKMELDDFRKVVDVHLMGSVIPTKALWEHFRQNEYGRIVYTTSSSGLYGNFGQSNYGAAKGGIYGLTRVLAIEGRKYGIKAMCMSPSALTRMTEDLPKYRELMESDDGFPVAGQPDTIAQSMVYMCSDLCGMDKSGKVMHVGRPGIAELKVMRSGGWEPDYAYTAQDIADREDQIFFPDDD